MLNIGSQAPDFTVTLGSGERFTLSEQRGRNIVLFFYPRAFTPGCTAEVGGFCESYDDLSAGNAVVIGISTNSVDRVKRFGEAVGTPFDLGSECCGGDTPGCTMLNAGSGWVRLALLTLLMATESSVARSTMSSG